MANKHKKPEQITRAEFKAYEKVRNSGKWNMLVDIEHAGPATKLDPQTYLGILLYYSHLANRWPEIVGTR